MLLELFQQVEDLPEGLHLLLDALFLPVGGYLQAESEGNREEGILASLIVVRLEVLEEFVLRGNLVVGLKVVDHLAEVVGQPLEVDLLGNRAPSEVEVRLLIVAHLGPEVGSGLCHDSPHQSGVIPVEDLVLENSTALGLRRELIEQTPGQAASQRSNLELRHPLHYRLGLTDLSSGRLRGRNLSRVEANGGVGLGFARVSCSLALQGLICLICLGGA